VDVRRRIVLIATMRGANSAVAILGWSLAGNLARFFLAASATMTVQFIE